MRGERRERVRDEQEGHGKVGRRARVVEAPVSYRLRRAGKSKVSGTIKGTVLAGTVILGTTFRYARWS